MVFHVLLNRSVLTSLWKGSSPFTAQLVGAGAFAATLEGTASFQRLFLRFREAFFSFLPSPPPLLFPKSTSMALSLVVLLEGGRPRERVVNWDRPCAFFFDRSSRFSLRPLFLLL